MIGYHLQTAGCLKSDNHAESSHSDYQPVEVANNGQLVSSNHKTNAYITLAKRLRRWANVIQALYEGVVFLGWRENQSFPGAGVSYDMFNTLFTELVKEKLCHRRLYSAN